MVNIYGTNSFKYRHIENMYGTLYVCLDDNAYVKDNELYISMNELGNKNSIIKKANFKLVNQSKMITGSSKATDMTIKNMGYDEQNKFILMPTEIGASTSSYYSDFFYSGNVKNQKYILVYGGTWDNSSSAGIFNMRAFENVSSRKNANGSRLIIK